jgi:REP element-mobilizing transposase RayT
MTNGEKDECRRFIRAYPIRNGLQYHVVFVPKRRRKAIFGQTRRQPGAIFQALAQQKECHIIEGRLMPDHVHMYIAIPPGTRLLL